MDESQVFAHALKLATPAERAAYLAAACGGNPKLQEDVEALLRAHDTNPGFLEQPAVALGMDTVPGPKLDAKAGDDLAFLTASDRPDSLGRVAHYEILEVIGQGGMGVVLRALDEKLHRVAAIKVMAAHLATNATARKRFTREAQAAAAVTHDHIVTIYAVDEAAGLPYLAMQYIAGVSLQQRIDRSGPLRLEEILRIGMQTASGLAAAHAQGLIHRDIKPANILLENGVERVKITDFGLARAADDANLTQSSMVAGTPHYMSPEQAQGTALDQRSDLFSLGSVMYAMCTGRAPFRASGTVAVLKRVCEEVPTPVSQINSAIPLWLAAIIEKLHAKDPAERYQSAAEVAEVLGRHLAHVQHPSVMPLPQTVAEPVPGVGRPNRSHAAFGPWWTVAAVLLVLVFGGLSLTEATGVTRLVPTVIRILTPDGTLVVETGDPSVKVTVEGDGGLTIVGAGLEEIRLKPGSYKLHADKNGQRVPLERDVVSIAKGGLEVVRVKLETSATPVVTQNEKGAFVLLAAGQERKYDTLAEAVQVATDGDTIEIRGNGPFVTAPIEVRKKALTLCAGTGYWPVICLRPQYLKQPDALLLSESPLTLEGVELQRLHSGEDGVGVGAVVHARGPLRIANVRLVHTGAATALGLSHNWASAEIVNSQMISRWSGLSCWEDGSLVVRNSVFPRANPLGWGLSLNMRDRPMNASITLLNNTFAGEEAIRFGFWGSGKWVNDGSEPGPFSLEASGNVLACRCVASMIWRDETGINTNDEARAGMRRLGAWKEAKNLYGAQSFLGLGVNNESVSLLDTYEDWRTFWNLSTSPSRQGEPQFQGVDYQRPQPEKKWHEALPTDFRLRPDSAGYRAGADGKDLGADVDLVGPGAAYERWKKTPEYQQWLKDTEQLRSAASKPEPKAFIVLSGKGVEMRKFDTLAEAVQGASAGDTIEIRGNGPFVSEPIKIHKRALVIRAGGGFRPVIKLSPAGAQANAPLLMTNSALVLEGLDLQRDSPATTPIFKQFVNSQQARLHVANCRFLVPRVSCIWTYDSPLCEVRNCEFLNSDGIAIGGSQASGGQWTIDNCVHATKRALVYSSEEPNPDGGSIQLRRISAAAADGVWHALSKATALLDKNETVKPIRLEVSETILDANAVLVFNQDDRFLSETPLLAPPEAETVLLRLLDWQGRSNLYGDSLLEWRVGAKPVASSHVHQTLADWKQFWKSSETNSLQGRVRFKGGDLLSRLATAPDKITPDDFRLRADSPGYRAGPNGKDLGADVDLVGPGPAYERWKKMPEYQEWLKESGQRE